MKVYLHIPTVHVRDTALIYVPSMVLVRIGKKVTVTELQLQFLVLSPFGAANFAYLQWPRCLVQHDQHQALNRAYAQHSYNPPRGNTSTLAREYTESRKVHDGGCFC
jgi:hypothetical protein